MTRLFYQVLDLSITGSLVILRVLLLRILLRRAPKVFSYALWLLVLIRLLCPFAIEAPVSLLPDTKPVSDTFSSQTAVASAPEVSAAVPGEEIAIYETTPRNVEETTAAAVVSREMALDFCLAAVWAAGMLVMLLSGLVDLWYLNRRLIGAVAVDRRVYLADGIPSPFVLGLVLPKIYLPSGLHPKEQTFILLHERHHIRRGDPIWKALGYLALTIHWFNPLVWLAFFLAARDMEMSCDEAVIQYLGADTRADYSATLLSFSTGRHFPGGTPLAFGEGDTKGRIRNLLNWKRPRFWVVVFSALACVALAFGLLTDPQSPDAYLQLGERSHSRQVQYLLTREEPRNAVITLRKMEHGICSQQEMFTLSGSSTELNIRMDLRYEGNTPVGVQFRVDSGHAEENQHDMQLEFPEFAHSEKGTFGWGSSVRTAKEKLPIEAGASYTLGAWYFGTGSANIYSCSLLDQDPQLLKDQECAVVATIHFQDGPTGDTLMLDAVMRDNQSCSLAYLLNLGEQVAGLRIQPELWVEGSCTIYPGLTIPCTQALTELSLRVADFPGSMQSFEYGIRVGEERVRDTIPIPQDTGIAAWTTAMPEQGETWAVKPGESRILGAFSFVQTGERIPTDCDLYDKDPSYLENATCVLIFRGECLSALGEDTRAFGTPTQKEEPAGSGKKILTLQELVALSEKGAALSWEDFEPYAWQEGSAGWGYPCVRIYKMDTMLFSFRILGMDLNSPPEQMSISHTLDSNLNNDVRFMDVPAYIRRFEAAMTGDSIGEEYPREKIFLPLESDRNTSYYIPGDQEAWNKALRVAQAAAKEGGWPSQTAYSGLQVVFEETYYMLTDAGGFLIHSHDKVFTVPAEASAALRGLVEQVAERFYGGKRYTPQVLQDAAVTRAVLHRNGQSQELTQPEVLETLTRMLREASPMRSAAACDFGAKLILETAEGVLATVWIAQDGCENYTADGGYYRYKADLESGDILELFESGK